ncbi:glycosyltransferase [Larkinella punicea]|uniref:Glycosyltransferase family 2 protein n=1 Tax=Larkinella punicea TaxID=2315727 RepID=A0A368JL21_9BACT|nr:glycosyltransferase family 2 protein [Larkinella punicea]RCR68358.1 glycosyltransferase family 2 protein [Larkinella punicea]
MIVRVVMLNYNTVDLTLKCVDYVLQQNEPDCHIVVVDNGSLESNYQELKSKLPASVFLIRSQINAGFSAGNNRGCGRIKNLPDPDNYLFINSDAFLTQPGTIRALRTELENYPEAVAISPLVHTTSNSVPVRLQIQVRRLLSPGWLIVFHSPILRRLPFVRQRYHRFIYRDLVPYSEKTYPVESINGAVFMMKSDFLHHIGLLDEGTFLYLEEIVLGEQIRREGKICLLHGGVIVPHIQGATTGSQRGKLSKKSFNFFIDSEAYLLNKYHNYSSFNLGIIRKMRLFEFFIKSIRERFCQFIRI